MSEITALFWDVGGVLLTNGWDTPLRAEAVDRFGLEKADFDRRHEAAGVRLEQGQIGLDEYLDRVVFYRERPFSRDDFKRFIFEHSLPHAEVLALARAVAASGRYLMATLNNESADLNQYRIERYGLRDIFACFFSSCYLGVTKPDPTIYRIALDVTQRQPGECLLIDDREVNLPPARDIGMGTILFQDVARLERDLRKRGVAF